MFDKTTIVLATNNQKKRKEFAVLLGDQLSMACMADFQLESPAETGRTFVENALIKAQYVADKTQRPSLADDSGLVVPVLKGAPGLYSARFAGPNASDDDNNLALIEILQRNGWPYVDAHYHCTLVFVQHGADPDPIIAQGRWFGRIYPQASGQNGFGYDPLFYVGPDYKQSAGEMDPARKAAISHRGIAIHQLQQQLALHA